MSLDQLLVDLRGRIAEVAPGELQARLATKPPPLLLDVREADELEGGRLPGALHLPRGVLELRIESAVPTRSRAIVAYCASGVRSLFAADSLRKMGYTEVLSLAGGFDRWRQEGRPVERSRSLSAAQVRRYKRQLQLPELGEAGQVKLLDARVLVVGAGGLGSPAAYYLAAAGVGKLGIVDFDLVDESNLQRQILHDTHRLGQPKARSARETLLALNPGISVEAFEARLSHENVEEITSGYDLVVDGSDNFRTRYLINDTCVKLGLPNVHGSVQRFQGQVSVFHPPGGPCYRCLYPEPPEDAPNCAEAGVLGVLPGVIGLLQAVEVVKLIIGAGEPLVGRLLSYDALRAGFRELRLERDPACPCCGEDKLFPGFIDDGNIGEIQSLVPAREED